MENDSFAQVFLDIKGITGKNRTDYINFSFLRQRRVTCCFNLLGCQVLAITFIFKLGLINDIFDTTVFVH